MHHSKVAAALVVEVVDELIGGWVGGHPAEDPPIGLAGDEQHLDVDVQRRPRVVDHIGARG